jgi:hypothetical protein
MKAKNGNRSPEVSQGRGIEKKTTFAREKSKRRQFCFHGLDGAFVYLPLKLQIGGNDDRCRRGMFWEIGATMASRAVDGDPLKSNPSTATSHRI